jgi:hypothetical protein
LEVKIIKVEPRITAASRELITTIVLDKQLDYWKNQPLDQGSIRQEIRIVFFSECRNINNHEVGGLFQE